MAKTERNICVVEGCDRDVRYVRMGVCSACYQWLYYWQRQTPARFMKRWKQINVLQARAESISHNRRK